MTTTIAETIGDPARPPMTIGEIETHIGQEIGVSPWILIDQARIDRFAEVTEDRQFIHIDPVAAAASPFKGTIAHGFLSLSMLSRMAYDALPRVAGAAMGVNYGFDKVRFVSAVRAGARVRGRFTLKEVVRRSDKEVMMRNAVSVEIEGEPKPALVAEWIGITYLA